MTLRLAYLNSRYPSLSHTFIEREIRFLRELGVEIRTCSIRRPSAADLLGPTNRAAADETFYVFDSVPGLLARAAAGAVLHPLRTLRVLWSGQRLSPPGWKERLRHAAYAIEAIVLARRLAAEGIRHVHVHMANNGASVALLAGRYDPAGCCAAAHLDRSTIAAAAVIECAEMAFDAQLGALPNELDGHGFGTVEAGAMVFGGAGTLYHVPEVTGRPSGLHRCSRRTVDVRRSMVTAPELGTVTRVPSRTSEFRNAGSSQSAANRSLIATKRYSPAGKPLMV